MKPNALLIAILVALAHSTLAHAQESCKASLETDRLVGELADLHLKMADMTEGQDKLLLLSQIKKLHAEAARQFPDLKKRLDAAVEARRGGHAEAKVAEAAQIEEGHQQLRHAIRDELLDQELAKLIEGDPDRAYPEFLQHLMTNSYRASHLLKIFNRIPEARLDGYRIRKSNNPESVQKFFSMLGDYGVSISAFVYEGMLIPYDTLTVLIGLQRMSENDIDAEDAFRLLKAIRRIIDRPGYTRGDDFLMAISRRIIHDQFQRRYPYVDVFEKPEEPKAKPDTSKPRYGFMSFLGLRRTQPANRSGSDGKAAAQEQPRPSYVVRRSEVSLAVALLPMWNVTPDGQFDVLGSYQHSSPAMTDKELLYVLERTVATPKDGLRPDRDRMKLTRPVIDFMQKNNISMDNHSLIPHRLLFAYTALDGITAVTLNAEQQAKLREIVGDIVKDAGRYNYGLPMRLAQALLDKLDALIPAARE